MNRNLKMPIVSAQKSLENSPTDKKRKLKTKSKDSENDSLDTSKASNFESDEFSEQDSEQPSRKSKRLQSQGFARSPCSSVSPIQSGSRSVKVLEPNDRKQLNGAQFVAAAAAGNFNVSASIGSTSITIDSNSNPDLNHLSQNVEMLNATLKQHSMFLKQLNNSIEKLSHKLDSKVSNPEYFKKQAKSRRSAKNERKSPDPGEDEEKDDLEDDIQADELEEEEEDDEEEEVEPAEIIEDHSTFNKEADKKNNDEIENTDEIESINPNLKKTCESSGVKEDGQGIENLSDLGTEVNSGGAVAPVMDEKVEDMSLQHNDFQTVKLTNTMLEMEKECSVQSKSVFYSSDSSKSDDEDEEISKDRSSLTKSTTSHKSSNGTKAILNKTKIDTEFISKLIENKDPNDKRYDPNEINKLRLLSHSYQNFAVKLLMRLFDEEEIIGRNVYGRNYSGDKTFMKQPLDSDRINFIKETVLRLTRTNNPELAWASCVIAMNRKMVDINNKFIKQNTKK